VSAVSPETSAAARTFTVSKSDVGRRLDLYLASKMSDLSRTRIQELIDEGRARVSGHSSRRAHRVSAGEVVEVEIIPRPPLSAQAEEIPIELLYEDPDFVVVNKPAGMVVHAGAGISSGTLVNALLHRLGKLSAEGGVLRPGIVHRLDRGTSGVLVVARNDAAHRALGAQFRARTVQKTYIALLHGRLAREAGVIELPIARDPRRRTRMTARLRSGREARTSWRVLLRLGNSSVRTQGGFTLVEADLHTGRTHQIRAHFSAIGHPLAGDTLYGAPQHARAGRVELPPLGRVFLHAARLGFAAPRSGQRIEVRAPLDAALKTYLDELASAVEVMPHQVDAALRGYL
jgi:23S rRNA pseudouridine1911/1915/1917 synthase